MLVQTHSLELAPHADAAITKSDMGRKMAEAEHVIAAMEAQQREIADMLAKSHRIVEECRALMLEINYRGGSAEP